MSQAEMMSPGTDVRWHLRRPPPGGSQIHPFEVVGISADGRASYAAGCSSRREGHRKLGMIRRAISVHLDAG